MNLEGVLLFLTYRCNLRCGFCLSFNSYWAPDPSIQIPAATSPTISMGSTRNVQEMTTEEVINRVIPQCEAAGVRTVALSGGEVLVRQDAAEIFTALGRSGMTWCLDSNLMLCTDAIADSIVATGCNAVFFSLDGPQKVHDTLRCSRKSYAKGTEGLKRLVQARGKESKTKIIVNCVLQPGNESALEDMPALVSELGADAISFQLLSEHRKAHGFDAETAFLSLEAARVRALEIGLPLEVYPLSRPDPIDLGDWFGTRSTRFYRSCRYIHANLRIDPQGNVMPCLEHRIGNVLEEDLKEIWNGEVYSSFRRSLTEKGPFSACLRCCNMTVENAREDDHTTT